MSRWLLTLLVLWPAMVTAQPAGGDFIDPRVQARIEDSMHRAEAQLRIGRIDEARRYLDAGYALDPGYPPIVRRLAQLMMTQKNFPEAEHFYRKLLELQPTAEDAHFGLIDAIAHPDATKNKNKEALEIAIPITKTGKQHREAWRRIAKIRGYLGRYEAAEEAWSHVKRMLPKSNHGDDRLFDPTYLDLCEYHQLKGQIGRSMQFCAKCAQRTPDCRKRLSAMTNSQDGDRHRRAEYARKQSAVLRPELERIDDFIDQEKWTAAHKQLLEMYKKHPLVSGVHRRLGTTARKLGERDLAAQSFLQAIALGATTAHDYLNIAEFYEDAQSKTDPHNIHLANHYFGEAYRAAPDNLRIRFRYVNSLMALQRYERAYELTVAALQEDMTDTQRAEFSKLDEKLKDRLASGGGQVREAISDTGSYQEAKRLRDNGERDEAVALLRAVPMKKRSAQHWDLLGQIADDNNDPTVALGHYRAAIKRDSTRHDTRYRIAQILRKRGQLDEWVRTLEHAKKHGSTNATLDLLEHRIRPHEVVGRLGDVFRIRQLLDGSKNLNRMVGLPAYGDSAHQQRIRTLAKQVRSRLLVIYVTGGALGGLLVLILGVAARRRYGGVSVDELIRERPSTGPELQRVLSAIRHEVLKHNTTALTGLLDAITHGTNVSERAGWCYNSLFGGDLFEDQDDGLEDCPGNQAAALRLDDYLDQLRRIGRSHGIRLNLKNGDPTFSALIRGFDSLETLLPRLARLKPDQKIPNSLIRLLRDACEEINGIGYRGVVSVLEMLKVTLVDADFLVEIFNGIRNEPLLRKEEVMPLQLDVADGALPFQVALTLHDFEDILRNPMRNAIQASLEHQDTPEAVHIGLTVGQQIEPITGLMSVVLKIKDRCPVPLDPAILHSQDVERGLGLTAHLLIAHEGTISVCEEEAPWAKSVVIQLPLIESEGEWAL